VGEAIAEMEREYFTRRERNPKTETTWKVEYLSAFAKLPIDSAIDADLLMAAILSTEPDTRTRKRLCWVYNKIAAFAGIEGFDASPYSGRYRFNRHKLRDLPSDEDIVAMRESIANPEWRYAFSLMAAYGLRNHELFHLDRESLRSGVALILDGKTGRRKAWPFRPEWWEIWRLWEGELPAVSGLNNTEIGSRVTKYFTRAKLCKPYDLRHAWAVRTLEMGLDISLAAQQMGHSLAIHSEIYHDFIGERVHQKAFEEIRKNLLGAD
jgi:integrase